MLWACSVAATWPVWPGSHCYYSAASTELQHKCYRKQCCDLLVSIVETRYVNVHAGFIHSHLDGPGEDKASTMHDRLASEPTVASTLLWPPMDASGIEEKCHRLHAERIPCDLSRSLKDLINSISSDSELTGQVIRIIDKSKYMRVSNTESPELGEGGWRIRFPYQ